MIGLSILGSTGSIGMSTLDVLSGHPDRFRVMALTANTDVDRMIDQCRTHRPEMAVMADERAAEILRDRLHKELPDIDVQAGIDGLEKAASRPDADYVMAAIVGAAGLIPAMAAARAGKRILLANKEALVMSGKIFMDEVRRNGAELLPIDSEHNAIFQCMPGNYRTGGTPAGVRQIILTASGGPFRDWDPERLSGVTPEQACKHPNWSMGRKISIDSATMMNKGLEVIEATWLFDVDPSVIQVVIHRQSIIHSMVEYEDGSILAQLGYPDMRTPIAHALAWPERMTSGVRRLDIIEMSRLDFEQVSHDRYPCLALAYQAIQQGGTSPVTLNAANEIAVAAFLERSIAYADIPGVIEHTLANASVHSPDSIDAVLRADSESRDIARSFMNRAARLVKL
jgi:1-deoxy-D-xylulose-5-phosphate reductoisomerase